MGNSGSMLSPFEYSDFRVFLSDLIVLWKKEHRRWSYAVFSRDVGFASPNYLKQIVDGKRDLSSKASDKIVKYFGFNKQEGPFFKSLVNFTQAYSDYDKESAFIEMQNCLESSNRSSGAADYHRFYSEWHNPVIRELAATSSFSEDPEWIGKRLSPNISKKEAERALRFLQNSGQLTYNSDGQLEQADPVNRTGGEVASLAVANYHREMLTLAKDTLDTLSAEKRNISSLTMALSHETYKNIVDEIYKFQDKVIKMAVGDTSPEEVFQLNFQLFPTTDIDFEGGRE